VKGYGQTVSVGLEANDPDSISHPMKRYAIGSAGSKLYVPDSIILESHAHGPIKIQLPQQHPIIAVRWPFNSDLMVYVLTECRSPLRRTTLYLRLGFNLAETVPWL
jgi:hypothetical protein